MQFVGGLYIGEPDGVLDFIIRMFPRLTRDVKHIGSITRQVQYASGRVRFLGVEVERVDEIPGGMTAWVLGEDEWTMIEPRDGRDVVTWHGSLSWKWLDQSVAGRAVGEFSAMCPPEWSDGESKARRFELCSHGYLAVPEEFDDDVYLADYDPSWPARYEKIEKELIGLLGPDVALRIEHYGSTAIPGMPAKPVVDVLVEIPSFEQARMRAVPALNRPECEYWWYNDHMCFILRQKLMGKRTHHIHMAPAGHKLWDGLAFRDYMRSHPDDAGRYAALKYELADRHRSDREEYTRAKAEFVREITIKALAGK